MTTKANLTAHVNMKDLKGKEAINKCRIQLHDNSCKKGDHEFGGNLPKKFKKRDEIFSIVTCIFPKYLDKNYIFMFNSK